MARRKASAGSEPAATNSDAEVQAALDAWDSEAPEAESEIEAETTDEAEVTLGEDEAEAIAAELEAETSGDTDAAAASKPKAKRKPKVKAEETEQVPTREFHEVADQFSNKGAVTRTVNGITAKKVNEKAQNLVAHITSGKKLSGFTQLAVGLMVANGELTTKALVEAFMKDGKTEGTARAQAQQQMALFRTMQIAAPDGENAKVLKPCSNGLVKELTNAAA